MNSEWKNSTYSLTQLRSEAENLEPWDFGVFGFLKNCGVVPWSVESLPAEKVKFGFSPDAIPAGYLGAAAYEWDSWGPSQPSDFLDALDAELNPEKRDFIAQLLTALGRSIQ